MAIIDAVFVGSRRVPEALVFGTPLAIRADWQYRGQIAPKKMGQTIHKVRALRPLCRANVVNDNVLYHS